MGLIFRRNLDRPLTHEELDGNFLYLDINEWKLQSYEKGMWCYIKGNNDITDIYLCEVTHVQNIYPNGIFTDVVNNVRIWRPFSGGGGTYFENTSPSTATNLEGIPAGTTFASPHTMQEMWNLLLYPFQAPAFTFFQFDNNHTTMEVGYSFLTDVATWTTSNSSNVVDGSVYISGDNLVTHTGLTANGSEFLTFSPAVTRTSKGTKSWTITGTNTRSATFSRTSTLRWDWRFYWGTSLNTILNEAEIEELASSTVKSTFVGTYSFASGGYKYFCHADDYGNISSFYDNDTGFQVAMYDGYSHAGGGGSSYELISVTNSNGETINYRVYRTKNILGGSVNIRIA